MLAVCRWRGSDNASGDIDGVCGVVSVADLRISKLLDGLRQWNGWRCLLLTAEQIHDDRRGPARERSVRSGKRRGEEG